MRFDVDPWLSKHTAIPFLFSIVFNIRKNPITIELEGRKDEEKKPIYKDKIYLLLPDSKYIDAL